MFTIVITYSFIEDKENEFQEYFYVNDDDDDDHVDMNDSFDDLYRRFYKIYLNNICLSNGKSMNDFSTIIIDILK